VLSCRCVTKCSSLIFATSDISCEFDTCGAGGEWWSWSNWSLNSSMSESNLEFEASDFNSPCNVSSLWSNSVGGVGYLREGGGGKNGCGGSGGGDESAVCAT